METQALPQEVKQKIEAYLNESPIVLFMKGSADFPQCGFSARAVALLQHFGAEFTTVNVLEDQGIREGIKIYGNWPTIPQLYVNKALVGGSDIMMDMYEAGELETLLASVKKL